MKDDSDPVPLLKRQLAHEIIDHVGEAGQYVLARRIGVDQPRASDLEHGHLERFSLQQLVRFAARAGGKVTLEIRWTPRILMAAARRKPLLG